MFIPCTSLRRWKVGSPSNPCTATRQGLLYTTGNHTMPPKQDIGINSGQSLEFTIAIGVQRVPVRSTLVTGDW